MGTTLFCAIGHSAVRCADGIFKSSDLIQEAFEIQGRNIRTGIDAPGLDWDAPTAYLGGQYAVVEATARALETWGKGYVAVIAGRPPYLDAVAVNVPRVSEGSVMMNELVTLGCHEGYITLIDTNKVTAEDMQSVLTLGQDYAQIVVIMMAFRIPRAALLMRKYVMEHPELEETEHRVAFVPAEQYLPEQRADFERMTASAAYRRTMFDERFGIKLLLK